MTSVTLQEAQARLPDIIRTMTPGEEVVILRDNEPVASLVARGVHASQPREPGSEKDAVLFMAEDFDAPLDEFRDYMR
ncbi:MAG: type II toxin-antitoxin system prevent-host-death family antitoxin [Deltaproteobacteria bacterium]|nr:type II toxin-antitoxin system prevent-host-death family antitoxin [Deltaproteobacteria bacterium]